MLDATLINTIFTFQVGKNNTPMKVANYRLEITLTRLVLYDSASITSNTLCIGCFLEFKDFYIWQVFMYISKQRHNKLIVRDRRAKRLNKRMQ